MSATEYPADIEFNEQPLHSVADSRPEFPEMPPAHDVDYESDGGVAGRMCFVGLFEKSIIFNSTLDNHIFQHRDFRSIKIFLIDRS